MPTGIYERKPRIPIMSSCHPDREHDAHGMCSSCSHKAYYKKHKGRPVSIKDLPNGFYTYLWLREDGSPYYVGKGFGNRAYTSWSHAVHRPSALSRIILQEFESEKDAFSAEVFLIAYYGRLNTGTGCLRNLTDGGENPPNAKGIKRSEETKKKMSDAQKGPKGHWYGTKRPYRPSGTKGRKHSPEHVASIVASRLRNAEVRREHAGTQ